MKKSFFVFASAALLVCPWGTSAFGQSYPTKPIRIVVPFEAGGAMDIVARVISRKVADDGGMQIVIENKTGAGGAIGVVAVKDAAPDGYTLAEVSSSTHVLNPHTRTDIPYDPVRDFEPVVMLVKVPTLLVVPVDLPVNSLPELLALARKNEKGLNYGSAGIGSAPHITAALLAKATGLPMAHIPYRGLAGAMNDLVGARLDFVFSSVASLGGFVSDGKAKVLAVAGNSRIKSFPQVSSMAELGYPAVDVDLWFGIVAPLGTSPDIVRKLNEAFVKATNSPELGPQLAQLGVEIATGSPEAFKQTLESDNQRLGPFIKELMTKPK